MVKKRRRHTAAYKFRVALDTPHFSRFVVQTLGPTIILGAGESLTPMSLANSLPSGFVEIREHVFPGKLNLNWSETSQVPTSGEAATILSSSPETGVNE